MGSTVMILYLENREVQRLESSQKIREDAEDHRQRFTGNVNAKAKLALSLQVLSARQKMATEVLFLINELFTEFFSVVAATICGIILRDSTVVTLLRNEMSWSTLPVFLAVQFGPEVLDAWLIIVYSRYLGVDWPAVGKSFFGNPRTVMCKAACMINMILAFFFCGIGAE